MPRAAPYLSVVAAARNDDHGGNLLPRLQAFVNGLLGQCRRHGLDAELILVEWNPPADRPHLAEALRWPTDAPCRVRLIEVPAACHRRFAHADRLPLHQMLAKNVGLRRAHGRFLLATNIDILFSDELMAFLAAEQLAAGRLYRLDRHDVGADVPVSADVAEQLAWCRAHLLRVHTRAGCFPLTPDGQRCLFPEDIVAADEGLLLGAGWYPVEYTASGPFRWVGPAAELIVSRSPSAGAELTLPLTPGPGVGNRACTLAVHDETGHRVARCRVDGLRAVTVRLPGPCTRWQLRAEGGDRPTADDPRIRNFQAFGPLRWGRAPWAGAGRLWRQQAAALLTLGQPAQRNDPGPLPLHLGAAGDFTLMAREHWEAVRGYPEWPVYPLHVDSLLCYQAHHSGARETVLADPLRIYHIEHGDGTAWTGAGALPLLQRLEARGVPYLHAGQVLRWAATMRRREAALLCNDEGWGLAGEALRETMPLQARPGRPAEGRQPPERA